MKMKENINHNNTLYPKGGPAPSDKDLQKMFLAKGWAEEAKADEKIKPVSMKPEDVNSTKDEK